MKLDLRRKVCLLDDLPGLAATHRAAGRRVVLCHGCFDVVHPGHLRYLQFARGQGDVLVVSLTGDDAIEKADGTRPHVPQELRAETLSALEVVDHVVIAEGSTAEAVIDGLRPDLYVKGKEYEHTSHEGFLAEKSLVESFGGRVIYSSGEVVFSSSHLMEQLSGHLGEGRFGRAERLAACCRRWNVDRSLLSRMVTAGFAGTRVAVVGDAMLDRYILCDAGEVATDAPTLSLRPFDEAWYLGGAAVVAAHLASMGAHVHLVSAAAEDEAGELLRDRLDQLDVQHTMYNVRQTLPVKTRYLVQSQKVLKVDRSESCPLDSRIQRQLAARMHDLRHELDAVIYADFGCGTVSTSLLETLMPMLRPHVGTIAGDVSGPRRSLLAYRDADLLTPTERELRGVMGEADQSLPTLAAELMKTLGVPNLAVTMGQRGCVLFSPRDPQRHRWFEARLRCEYLPALSHHAVDSLGAGDAFLAASTLALASGATLPQAGYVGSAASALAVEQAGNQAVARSDLLRWIEARPELSAVVGSAAG
jgi:rfaE bifunctional protein kinase chain/domain/rfaE bifunctional protein nucleotidyltransferase chain/domain